MRPANSNQTAEDFEHFRNHEFWRTWGRSGQFQADASRARKFSIGVSKLLSVGFRCLIFGSAPLSLYSIDVLTIELAMTVSNSKGNWLPLAGSSGSRQMGCRGMQISRVGLPSVLAPTEGHQ